MIQGLADMVSHADVSAFHLVINLFGLNNKKYFALFP